MLAAHAYARYVISGILLLFLLHRCHSWRERAEVKNLLLEMCRDLVHDLARKGEAVWLYRRVFSPYASFAIGERVYIVRARFAAMLRTYLRNQMRIRRYTVEMLLRNALVLQRRTQSIYVLNDELIEFDIEISNEGNPLNWTRFEKHNCHVAGPPCELVPTRDGYRRRGAMDQALQLIENRRKLIREKYQPKKNKPPIDINAELNRSINFKYTTSSGYPNQQTDADFVNLAPDFMS
ncbi:uncharacterized protein LOC133529643 [Cydia pomonella]|uniref:uncharacterized protein LOC133529643 n=1 Tax=Cydia pomonella TaxID=82600 RepID=UPI002ADD43D0|nr:uncharacterized protein LOC133529643 [Cydia pomonella]